jgi:uncharacterized membrane protein YkoI
MRIGRGLSFIGALVLVGGADLGVSAGGRESLPAPAADAVRQLFPAASIVAVGQEREDGVLYYEVVLREGNETIEMEVTPDGTVGEVESRVELAAVPEIVRQAISRQAGRATVREIERHEIRGAPDGGVFVPVDPPRVLYEVAVELDGVRREVIIGADGKTLASKEDDQDSDDAEDDPGEMD